MSIYPRYWRSNECITTRNLLVFSRWVVLRDSIYYIGEGNGSPLQHFCLENPMDGGTWWATAHVLQRVGHDWATSLSLSRHCRPAHRTKDWVNTRRDLAGYRLTHPLLEVGRQARATRARRKEANSALEMASPHQLRAGSQSLTKSSWNPG